MDTILLTQNKKESNLKITDSEISLNQVVTQNSSSINQLLIRAKVTTITKKPGSLINTDLTKSNEYFFYLKLVKDVILCPNKASLTLSFIFEHCKLKLSSADHDPIEVVEFGILDNRDLSNGHLKFNIKTSAIIDYLVLNENSHRLIRGKNNYDLNYNCLYQNTQKITAKRFGYLLLNYLNTHIVDSSIKGYIDTLMPSYTEYMDNTVLSSMHPVIRDDIKNYLTVREPILITGAPDCGKSTLAKNLKFLIDEMCKNSCKVFEIPANSNTDQYNLFGYVDVESKEFIPGLLLQPENLNHCLVIIDEATRMRTQVADSMLSLLTNRKDMAGDIIPLSMSGAREPIYIGWEHTGKDGICNKIRYADKLGKTVFLFGEYWFLALTANNEDRVELHPVSSALLRRCRPIEVFPPSNTHLVRSGRNIFDEKINHIESLYPEYVLDTQIKNDLLTKIYDLALLINRGREMPCIGLGYGTYESALYRFIVSSLSVQLRYARMFEVIILPKLLDYTYYRSNLTQDELRLAQQTLISECKKLLDIKENEYF